MNRGDVATPPCFEIQSNLLEWGVAGSIRGANRILVATLASPSPGSIKANENPISNRQGFPLLSVRRFCSSQCKLLMPVSRPSRNDLESCRQRNLSIGYGIQHYLAMIPHQILFDFYQGLPTVAQRLKVAQKACGDIIGCRSIGFLSGVCAILISSWEP